MSWQVGGLCAGLVALVVGQNLTPARAETDLPFIGDTVAMTNAFFGCAKQADFDKIKSLALIEKDREAADKYGLRNCTVLSPSTEMRVSDTSVWHGSVCVRPKGEPDCFWTARSLVKILVRANGSK
jgi:hypothetical protein